MLNLGVKALNDTTNRVGDDFTPEFSGIFSYANDDKTFGVGLSASYQKRDSGSSSSTVNDWHIQPWNSTNGGASRDAGAPLYVNNNDTPCIASDDFVAGDDRQCAGERPALRHPERHPLRVLGFERERTNAQ